MASLPKAVSRSQARTAAPTSLPSSAALPLPSFPDPIPGIITTGSVNILAGASGVGKTCLLTGLLSRLKDGKDIFGVPSHAPAAIGYICADRGASTARHWLERAGYPELQLYALVDDPTFSTARLRNKFQLVATLEGIIDGLNLPAGALIIVDPLTLFMGNPNDYQGCAIACIEIRRACLRRSLTLIGTAHASKQKADAKAQYKRLQDRILGSAAQLGYGDTQMYLASPEETGEKFYTFLWHPHTMPAQAFALGRDPEGRFVDWLEGTQAQEEGKILAAVTADESGTSFAEIQVQAEASRATVFRYLQELVKDGRVLKVGHGRYRKAPPN